MEENEDEPEDVRKATPVEEEIKKGEIDEHSERPARPFEDSTRKRHHCEKNVSKKKILKSEGECCRAKLAKAARAPKTATVFVYEKECVLPKIKAIPRHCLTKDEWIDILATPSRKCPSPCLQKAVTRRIRPVSARMAELAQPPKQRLLNTLQDRGGTLPTELVDNLIQSLEGETCLTPEQAEKMFRDKDNRVKKKCRKKNKTKCKSEKAAKNSEPGIYANVSSLDKEAVHCQYLMAESFVKSILEWKCPIPREEFKDIADVILKRLGYILEYSPVNGEDRKSQQMRFLADIIASWISGVLFDVAEAKKTELEEECERRRTEKEEEADEESDDETDDESDDDDDDDHSKRPEGRGGPPRRGKDDKRKKGGTDGKDDDDHKKPGKQGKRKDSKETLETGEVKDSAGKVTDDSPSKSPPHDPTTKQQDKGASEEEIFHDARADPGSQSEMEEKKTPIQKTEDTDPEERNKDEAIMDSERGKQKEEKSDDEIPKDSPIQQHTQPENSSAKVEALTAKVEDGGEKHTSFEDLREKALESKQSPELVRGDEGIANDVTLAESVNALQQSKDDSEKIPDEKKIGDAAIDYSQPLAVVKEPVKEKPTKTNGEAIPIATTTSSEESADGPVAKVTHVSELEKEVIAGVPTDERAAGDKMDTKDIAAKLTMEPEVTSISEAKKKEAIGTSSLPVDFGDAGIQEKQDLPITSPIPDSPIVEKEESEKDETRKSIGDSSQIIPADEAKTTEMKLTEDEELKKNITVETSQDAEILKTEEKLKEDDVPKTKTTAELSEDPSIRVTAEELDTAKMELHEDDELRTIAEPFKDPSIRLTTDESKSAEIELKEDDELRKIVEPTDPSRLTIAEDSKDRAVELVEDDEPKKSVEASEDPSKLITTIESLVGKRKEAEQKRPSKQYTDGEVVVAKKYETDVPFVTFDKIFHTVYNAIEASNENPGDDSITNRIHRVVYEKLSSVVQEEIPGPLPERTKDMLDVMTGKFAIWIRDVLTDSEMSFMNKLPAIVESIEVREWGNWIDNMFETANTWSRWIQQTIRQAADMKTNQVTRREWQEWTKSVETDALRWRRFYLESRHQAHQNLTIIRDRHVVKTRSTERVDDRKGDYEKEMKITDLEV